MSLNVELLEQSFRAVAPQGEALIARFYQRLFEKYPEVRPLFTNVDMHVQHKKLLMAIRLVIENLRKPDALRAALLKMGERHVSYGVKSAHYPAVTENLLAVLAETAGPAWTQEMHVAWKAALEAMNQIMCEGAAAEEQRRAGTRSQSDSQNRQSGDRKNKGDATMGDSKHRGKGMGIAAKLMILCVVFGVIPLIAMGAMTFWAAGNIEDDVGASYQTAAETIADKIDRNLFERYGDVQAFGLNQVVQDREQWGQPLAHNLIARAMNQYVVTYGIYSLMILVDTHGNPIAVNSKDAAGRVVNSDYLMTKNFRHTPWFQALSNGRYTTAMEFSGSGNDVSTGTFIEDVHVDEDVKRVYPGDDGLTLGFSAPVYGADGHVVAYWSNRAKFSLVEEIFQQSYQTLKNEGFPGAELTLLDREGHVIVDYDPSVAGSLSVSHDMNAVLMKLNLADKGVAAAQEAVAGRSGYLTAVHARKGIEQVSGYSHLHGALGYPGMNWSVLVRVPKDEATAFAANLKQSVVIVGLVCLALVAPLGWWVGRSGAVNVKRVQNAAERMARGDYGSRVDVASGDEIGDLGATFNRMAADVQQKNTEMARINAIVENAPINILFADRDCKIRYMNPASEKTLKSLEHLLPIKVDQMVGSSIDVFHKNPDVQRRIVGDPSNLPHQAQINVGDEVLELLVSAIYDDQRNYLGPMVSWSVVTERVKTEREIALKSAIIENAPVNILFADLNCNIQYMNPASETTLKEIEHLLPIKVKDIVGSSIDVFHKHPEMQRKLLSDPSNLPHQAQIRLGEEILDLLVSPIYDDQRNYMGPMVSWSVVTEKIKADKEIALIKSIVENAPINIMYADRDFTIRYINPASFNTLKGIEHLLPIKADQVVGQSVDIFHKNPAHQRRILGDPANLPHSALIKVGEEDLDLQISAIYDNNKEYLGAMVSWSVVTEKLRTEREVSEASERERENSEKLQHGVSQIASIATTLASAAEELNSVSSQMGGMAEETSSQATIVAAAAEQVSTNIQSVATGSEEMTVSIKEIAKSTSDSARVASQAVTVAETANTTVGKLDQSSAEISSIIKVINSIAEQTNLLALNATIEAARAGEAGKGFAVVANEVKELAKETTKATESIGRMIETIQEDTKGAVDAIGQIGTIIRQVNDFQNTVASAVEEQTVTTNEMSRNVTEASKGGMEIASNITTVAEAAASTNEGTKQTKEAAEELARMASNLQAVVAQLT